MKRLLVFFGIFLFLTVFGNKNYTIKNFSINKVVIDAGHGGHDPGCLEGNIAEKDIALSIALKLGTYIEKNFPSVKVIYTRSSDNFVELYKRAQIANESKSDLFISIHCNANPSSKPFGTETYVMGLHKTQANLDVAMKENSSILMEDDYSNKYDGFDPKSPEANIIFSLFQNAFLDQSLDLAAKIENNFKEKTKMFNRGVKQAGFLVLYKTTMPAVLIETGFLSNKRDKQTLSTDKGQNLIASAIFKAFKEYKLTVEGNQISKNKVTIADNDTKTNQEISENIEIKQSESNENSEVPQQTLYEKPKQKNTKTETIDKKDISTNKEAKTTLITTKNDNTVNNTVISKKEIVFKVQITTSKKRKSVNSVTFKDLTNVQEYFHDGLYKYTVGQEKTLEAAVKLQANLQAKGFNDAFVVAFLNDERISPQEAIKLMKK